MKGRDNTSRRVMRPQAICVDICPDNETLLPTLGPMAKSTPKPSSAGKRAKPAPRISSASAKKTVTSVTKGDAATGYYSMAPAPGKNREERVDFRATSYEKRLIQRAADREGISMASFILKIVLPEAERIATEEPQILLSEADFARFHDALDRNPKILPNVRKLARKGSPFVASEE